MRVRLSLTPRIGSAETGDRVHTQMAVISGIDPSAIELAYPLKLEVEPQGFALMVQLSAMLRGRYSSIAEYLDVSDASARSKFPERVAIRQEFIDAHLNHTERGALKKDETGCLQMKGVGYEKANERIVAHGWDLFGGFAFSFGCEDGTGTCQAGIGNSAGAQPHGCD